MKKQSLKRFFGLVVSLSLVAIVLAQKVPAHPTVPPLPNGCDEYYSVGNTGCLAASGCGLFAPNVGIEWDLRWYCCYDDTGHLKSGQPMGPWCDWHYLTGNSICCTNLDNTSHCPDNSTATCPNVR